MKNHLSGSITTEAALIFPMIFGICLIFIQLALYFVTIEYTKAVCDRGLIIGHTLELEDESQNSVHSYIEKTMEENSFISSISQLEITTKNYWVFKTMEIEVGGIFEIFYPMDFSVSVKGFIESPMEFCNLTDLIMQSKDRIADMAENKK